MVRRGVMRDDAEGYPVEVMGSERKGEGERVNQALQRNSQ